MPTQRPAERPQKRADRERDQQHDPRDQRMQIRVALTLQLDPRSAMEGEPVSKLMDGERRRRHQRERREPSEHHAPGVRHRHVRNQDTDATRGRGD
jgi:hypothetical protein